MASLATGLQLRTATLVAVVALSTACHSGRVDIQAFAAATGSEVPPTPSTVPITLYFRAPAAEASHLVAVEREIAKGEDPARRALELLIAGPNGSEGLPVLPEDVTIERFEVEDEVAHIVLDGDLDGGKRPADDSGSRHGLLTLAALANTLTEFASITEVRLRTLDDQSSTAFGGWGIPPTLVRDESFIAAPSDGDPVAQLQSFSNGPQVVRSSRLEGDASDDAVSRVASVRVLDRLAYVRVVVELTGAADDAVAHVPRAEAASVGNLLRLKVNDVESSGDLPVAVSGPGGPVSEVSLRPDGEDLVLNITTENRRPPAFSLVTDVHPARIILDVKK